MQALDRKLRAFVKAEAEAGAEGENKDEKR